MDHGYLAQYILLYFTTNRRRNCNIRLNDGIIRNSSSIFCKIQILKNNMLLLFVLLLFHLKLYPNLRYILVLLNLVVLLFLHILLLLFLLHKIQILKNNKRQLKGAVFIYEKVCCFKLNCRDLIQRKCSYKSPHMNR